jgi:REP element-mobilizing transposase RayT
MPQSLTQIFIHLIFATKKRQPRITPEIEERLFSYLGTICSEMGATPIQVGGYRNHIHMLFLMPKYVTLVDLIKKIKATSSIWLKTQGQEFHDFYWAEGYAAFSIDRNGKDKIVRYIQNQEAHHSKTLFESELESLLDQEEIPFDKRYLWD